MAIQRPGLCAFATAFVLVCQTRGFAAEPAAEQVAAPAKVNITIGKETTYVTEPLRTDGYPDYLAALNLRLSKDVTPENNAAVLLAKAYGPKVLDEKIRATTYRMLGMAPPPEDGNYLVSRQEMIRRWVAKPKDGIKPLTAEEYDEQFDAATDRPWSAKELPIVAEWLAVNEEPLKLAVEASKRPKYYWPYVLSPHDDGQSLLSVLLPQAQESRDLAVLLAARAMHRTGEGNIEGAWQDILACHRLARKVAEGFCIVEALVGCAIESIACNAEVPFAHYGKLTARQAKQFQVELRQLSPVCRMADRFDIGERFMFLDVTAQLAREGNSSIFDVAESLKSISKGNQKKKKKREPLFNPTGIDWNVPLKMGNEWYDRITKIAQIEDVRKRREACQEFDADLRKLAADFKKGGNQLWGWLTAASSKEYASPRIGTILVSLLLPALTAAVEAEDRTNLSSEMSKIALALAAYRADHGSYPEKLDAVVPKYTANLPDDTFRDQPGPFGYRREGDAYLLWSVHRNGIDENGISYDDDPPGDDLVLRPVPQKKK